MKVDSHKIKRVWINQPSTHSPYHKLHGKVAIAVPEDSGMSRIYFTEGAVISQLIPSWALSDHHCKTNEHKYCLCQNQ
jgi:hypothetical protein